jgi:hypothetical protein
MPNAPLDAFNDDLVKASAAAIYSDDNPPTCVQPRKLQ